MTQKIACDYIIKGCMIVDGTGSPAFLSDIAIDQDKIVAIGANVDHYTAPDVMNAKGCVLAPGFIDVHTHDDQATVDARHLVPKVSQGVTTIVTGNCGISLAPFDNPAVTYPYPPLDLLGGIENFKYKDFSAYFEALNKNPSQLNIVPLIGHTTLRANVMDDPYRSATVVEIDKMTSLAEIAMQQGAVGFSTGLTYPPAFQCHEDEVIEIAKVVAKYDGIYTTHMRDEGDHIIDSLDESIRVGKASDIPVHISHLKCAGIKNFGRSREVLEKISNSPEIISVDCYPYTYGSTILDEIFYKMSKETRVTWSKPHPEMAGKKLSDIAVLWKMDELSAIKKCQPAGGLYLMMDDADVENILVYPNTVIGSDGLNSGSDAHCIFGHQADKASYVIQNDVADVPCHPRLYGTFTKILGHYVREKKLLSLEDAVRKMTGLPAEKFRIKNRGFIKVGYFADLVLFDPNQVSDKATLENPREKSQGILQVIVNGKIAYDNKKIIPTSFSGEMLTLNE